MPRRDRILPKEVRWRGSKCVSRVPAPLVPDGEARRTQQSHPSMLNGLGVHYGRFNYTVRWIPPHVAPPRQREAPACPPRACRVCSGRDWVGLSITYSYRASLHVGARTSVAPRVDDQVRAAGYTPPVALPRRRTTQHARHVRAERVGWVWAGPSIKYRLQRVPTSDTHTCT